jgi:hypothetical protein
VLTGLTRLLLAQAEAPASRRADLQSRRRHRTLVLRTIAERLAKDTTLVLVTHKLQLVTSCSA